MPKIKSKSAWMRDWINRIDGKTTYTTDGTIVYCQPCQQQVENQPFSSRQQQQQDNENNLQAPSRVAKFRELCDLPLPPRPIITRWATWLRAALYYSEHLDQIGAIVECFNQNDSDAIKKSQISFKIPNVQADLAFIRANFHYLPDAIEKLEARDLLLVESLDILADVGNEINLVPGPVGIVMQEKFGNVLLNNPGFDQMREIGMVLRGEHVQMHLPPDVIAKFKYAPIQSCEVERSFSIYKHILADNRMSFTTENLEKFLICNCKNNC